MLGQQCAHLSHGQLPRWVLLACLFCSKHCGAAGQSLLCAQTTVAVLANIPLAPIGKSVGVVPLITGIHSIGKTYRDDGF